MNASEAIQLMEHKLKVEKLHVEKIISENEISLPDDVKEMWREKVRALSIILESAKYLHEEVIDQNLIKNEDSFRVLCLLTDLEEYKEITYDQARAIGLEEGADE